MRIVRAIAASWFSFAGLCGVARASEPVRGAVAMPAVVAPAVARRDLIDLGPAPLSTAVRIAVMLRYRNEAELERLIELQGTPGSRLYRHFLTREQFSDYFSPTPQTFARVASSLRTAGFTIGPAYPNRTLIDAEGSVRVAEAFFATSIHRVAQRNHGIRYANVMPATIPRSIAGDVTSVLGIDDVVKFHTPHVAAELPSSSEGATASSPLLSGPIERTQGGSFAGLYPTGIAKAYEFPAQSGFTGTGHPIAVVMDSDIANSDLTTFWKAAGIARTGNFNRILADGTNPGITADAGETAIDTEVSTGLAPGADVDLYLVTSLDDQALEDAYNLAVSDHIVDVVSSSFGGCELDDTPFATASDQIAEQGASEGLTFVASSGDAGGYCEDSNSQGIYYEADIVNNPASNPHFVAVGATALNVDATSGVRVSETAWGPGGQNGGSGGGVSSFWSLPSYQAGIEGMTVVPSIAVTPPASQPNGGFAGRNLPDIALDGSNQSGSYVAIYQQGAWTGYGGTSVSAPMFAALTAERNQQAGARSGFANPALYANFSLSGTQPSGSYGTEFYDVTSGSTGPWSASVGYDRTTGIGSYANAAAAPATQVGPLLVTVSSSPNPYAIEGYTSVASSSGVLGYGSIAGDTGVTGKVTSPSSYGVAGYSYATTGYGTGVYGYSADGYGVYGQSASTQAAVYGVNRTAAAPALYGYAAGNGVLGVSTAINAIYGKTETSSTTGHYAGVYGQDASTAGSHYGVEGTSANGSGVYGLSTVGNGVFGIATAGGSGVVAEALDAKSRALGIYTEAGGVPIEAFSGTTPIMSLDASGNLTLSGKLTVNGTPLSVARDAEGAGRVMYLPQQTLGTIEDFGEGRMIDGRAFVALDPAFAALVDEGSHYFVYVTPLGDSAGVYVERESLTGFVVRENLGRHTSVAFDYRIVARPRAARDETRLAPYRDSYRPRVRP